MSNKESEIPIEDRQPQQEPERLAIDGEVDSWINNASSDLPDTLMTSKVVMGKPRNKKVNVGKQHGEDVDFTIERTTAEVIGEKIDGTLHSRPATPEEWGGGLETISKAEAQSMVEDEDLPRTHKAATHNEPFDPHTSRDPALLRDYFKRIGFSDEEIDAFIPGWTRTEPQTKEEVRSGIEWERENRMQGADEIISQATKTSADTSR